MSDLTTKAIELVQQATAADHEQRYQDAFRLYQLSLQYFLTAMKYEKNERMKEVIGQKMGEYMTRAEQIKTLLGMQSGGAGGSGPSASSSGPTATPDPAGGSDKTKEAPTLLMKKPNVRWSDVAGLDSAKEELQEAVILPMRFPELFVGARKPWTGILLYGPPGTGKSFLAKAVATESDSAFFAVSANDLISKWQGDSEKLLHDLFEKAREMKPSVVFFDEVDALLPTRSDAQSDSIHRFITQFLQEMDGVGKDSTGVLVLAATNTPWTLDPAARRRFQRRIFIGLPDPAARRRIFELGLGDTPHGLTKADFIKLATMTEGYSGSDISSICRGAIMAPVRKLQRATHFKPARRGEKVGFTPCSPGDPEAREMTWRDLQSSQLIEPELSYRDFEIALEATKPSVSPGELEKLRAYTEEFGSDGS